MMSVLGHHLTRMEDSENLNCCESFLAAMIQSPENWSVKFPWQEKYRGKSRKSHSMKANSDINPAVISTVFNIVVIFIVFSNVFQAKNKYNGSRKHEKPGSECSGYLENDTNSQKIREQIVVKVKRKAQKYPRLKI